MTSNKKQLYRTIVKTLGFMGICVLSYFLLRSIVVPPSPQTMQRSKPVTVDLASIPEGKIHIVQWNHNNIAVLHRPKEMQSDIQNSVKNIKYFVFNNKGGDINCPLVVEPTSKTQLKDICSGYLYSGSGKLINKSSRVQNLIIPPHHFIGQNTLIIGEEKVRINSTSINN